MKLTLIVLLLLISITSLVVGQQIALTDIFKWAQELKTSNASMALFVLFSIAISFINIPLGVFTKLIAGWIFGFAGGVLISHSSLLVGSWLAFRTARYLGKDFIEKRWSKQMSRLNHLLGQDQLMSVIRIRIFPLIPLPVTNLCLGVTKVSDTQFILGSALGMLPATCFYAYLGAQLKHMPVESLNSKNLLPYYCYILIALIASWLLPRLKRNSHDSNRNTI